MRKRWCFVTLALVIASLSLLAVPCLAVPPTLDDLWAGTAQFVLDAQGIQNMAFVRMLWDQDQNGNPQIWCYHWKWQNFPGGGFGLATGRAVSSQSLGSRCGLDWTFDTGYALPCGGTQLWAWPFNSGSLGHLIGRAESDGWSANTAQDSEGWLSYGPYSTAVYKGKMDVGFNLMIDNNSGNSENVCRIDAYDATTSTVIASRDIRRNEFWNPMTYQQFHLNITVPEWNHMMEFRVYWYDRAYIKFQQVGVAEGWYNSQYLYMGHLDTYDSTFPGVVKESDGTYTMVYEASPPDGYGGGSAPDIGLATSGDGITFHRNTTNPCLSHNTSGWEVSGIGTPSLQKSGPYYYLYYHGFNQTDCQIGFANGSNILALTKYGYNPVLPTISGTWEAGTTGKRSTFIQAPSGYWYMAYEGSTDMNPDFGLSVWSSGIARSSDWVNWTRYSGNPVIPATSPNPSIPGSGMGQDGPEMIRIPDSLGQQWTYLYVNTAAPVIDFSQKRYKLVWK